MSKSLIARIEELKERRKAPNGKEYEGLSIHSNDLLSREFGLPKREVEIVALKNNIIPLRYQRNLGTVGIQGQVKLLQSTIAVIGVGGLGGTIVELLARVGVGHIVVVDYGKFSEETLNRQLISTENDLGKYKAAIAAARVKAINSAVEVTTYTDAITQENIREVIRGAQVVVDGLDSLPPRFMVAQAAKQEGIPFVHGAIAGFTGQVMTIFPEDAEFAFIYGSSEKVPNHGIEAETGNPPTTPAMVAAWQVQEVIKIITGIGRLLRSRLLWIDGNEGTVSEIDFREVKSRTG